MKNTKLRRFGILGGTTALALAAGSALAAAPANAAPAHSDVWDKVAQCESGGNFHTNTGNGFSGAYQFTPSTWRANGGHGAAHNASPAEQKRVAKNVLRTQGPGAWPHCSKVAGLTRANGGAASASAPRQAPVQHRAAVRQAPVQKRAVTNNYGTQKLQRTAKQTPVQQAPVQQAPKHVAAPATNAPTVNKDIKGSGKFVTVKSGDTLGTIAKSHKIENWEDLYSVNAKTVSNPDLIFVGEKLELPAK